MCTHVRFCIDFCPCYCLIYTGTLSVNNKDRSQKLINVKLIYYKYTHDHIKLQWNVLIVPIILHSSCINMYPCSRALEYCLLAHFFSITFEYEYNNMHTCPRLPKYCLLPFLYCVFPFPYFHLRIWV